ncbi:type IV secretory system conjugative DNA transfer family protein [Candidatus Shapirobacteria bacterium]|nr:type IV secretory system conjugative DNA transfer family protein [Candidatus Shapirobacteria bacterium]
MTIISTWQGKIIGFLISLGIFGLTLVVLFGLGVVFSFWWRWRKREEDSLKFVLLQIRVPDENEIKIEAMEQVFSSLASLYKGGKFNFLKPQPHLSFEIVGKPGKISFYASCPLKLQELVERQIYGAYQDAQIKKVDEYNIFSERGKVAYAWLQLASQPYKPLKNYKELSVDPLSTVTSTLAKLKEGEGLAIQVLISPAEGKWQKIGQSYVSGVKKGEADPQKAKFKVDAQTLEAIESKCSKPGFITSLRIVSVAPSSEEAKSNLDNIKTALAQFTSPWNRFKGKKIRFKKSFMMDFIYRYQPIFWWKQETILSSEELAGIFHFPNKMVETPGIDWLRSKQASASSLLPPRGLFLGTNRYRGEDKNIFLKDKDRNRHIYIIGKTGTGKSELLKRMIIQDIEAGKGLCLIDPHDAVEQILERIPPERAEDVIYFDPSNLERPMGINLMEVNSEDEKHFVTSSIINLMYKLYDPYKTGIVGPRFEHAIRNAMLTVMSEPGNTFIEVVRCLTDSKYVQELLPKVTDPVVRRYWTDQIAQTSDFHKSETLDYIVSKFGRFVTNKMIRNIIGQSQSSFDFRKVMDEGKILLISLAKGKIGEENSSFLGLIMVPRILMAAMSRQDVPEEQRRDFYLYVDEFQNFATPDFAQILSEARKYHLNLTVANQFVGQMEEEVKNAVFGNVGTIISFRVGVSDANYLTREFQPIFNEEDLLNVERFNAYIKTLVGNEPVSPFSMDTTKDLEVENAKKNFKLAETIKRLSTLKYGRPREVVEAEINARSGL